MLCQFDFDRGFRDGFWKEAIALPPLEGEVFGQACSSRFDRNRISIG
jgi:hypothetical protein